MVVTSSTAAMLLPTARVWIRSSSTTTAVDVAVNGSSRDERCIFGKSVFNALTATATTITTESSPSVEQTNGMHYDRQMISLWEEIPIISDADAKEETNTTVSKHQFADDPNSSPYRIFLARSSPESTEEATSITDNACRIRHWPQLPLGRAKSFPPLGATACPTTVKSPPNNPKKPFTQLAVVGLVLDVTGKFVLLTRRPSYMRSFPGAWVLPGGGFDPETDASLQEALEREILEETGLQLVTRDDGDDEHTATTSSTPMCLWESCYPTDPSHPDPIKGHYLVVFHQACARSPPEKKDESAETRTALPVLKLQESEVDSALWLSVEDLQQVLTRMKEGVTSKKGDSSADDTVPRPPLKSVPICKADGSVELGSLDTLVGIYPQPDRQRKQQPGQEKVDRGDSRPRQEWCGIAQGSLFALEELLLLSHAANPSKNTAKTRWIS